MISTVNLNTQMESLVLGSEKLQRKLKRLKPPKDEKDVEAFEKYQLTKEKAEREFHTKKGQIESISQTLKSRLSNRILNECKSMGCRRGKQNTPSQKSNSPRKVKRSRRDYCKFHWFLHKR